MKNLKNQIVNIFIAIFITSSAMSCNTQQKDEHQEHDDVMHDDQTEMMDGEDHMDDGEHAEEHMMNDSATMQMNDEME